MLDLLVCIVNKLELYLKTLTFTFEKVFNHKSILYTHQQKKSKSEKNMLSNLINLIDPRTNLTIYKNADEAMKHMNMCGFCHQQIAEYCTNLFDLTGDTTIPHTCHDCLANMITDLYLCACASREGNEIKVPDKYKFVSGEMQTQAQIIKLGYEIEVPQEYRDNFQWSYMPHNSKIYFESSICFRRGNLKKNYKNYNWSENHRNKEREHKERLGIFENPNVKIALAWVKIYHYGRLAELMLERINLQYSDWRTNLFFCESCNKNIFCFDWDRHARLHRSGRVHEQNICDENERDGLDMKGELTGWNQWCSPNFAYKWHEQSWMNGLHALVNIKNPRQMHEIRKNSARLISLIVRNLPIQGMLHLLDKWIKAENDKKWFEKEGVFHTIIHTMIQFTLEYFRTITKLYFQFVLHSFPELHVIFQSFVDSKITVLQLK